MEKYNVPNHGCIVPSSGWKHCASLMSSKDKDNKEKDIPRSEGYITTLVSVKYGSSKVLVVNANAGLAGIMDYVGLTVGISDKDHVELCDESGRLINPDDFPPMMLLSAFIKPLADEATFIPIKVERDAGKQIVRLESLLTEPEKAELEILTRMKKENHVPKEKKGRGESASVRNHNQDGTSSAGSGGHSRESRKNAGQKTAK